MGFFDPKVEEKRRTEFKQENIQKLAPGVPDAWVEKYRPRTLNDIVGQERAVKFLQSILENPYECPNILFYGPAGTGKTTLAIVFLKALYGELYDDAVLELNASDERRLEDVRTKVKVKAGTYPPAGAPFNTVFLDEVDEMARQAQPAMRRIFEGQIASNNSRRCRFVLSCNQKSRVIDPIQSRCTPFFIGPLPPASIARRLQQIADVEKVSIEFDALETIAIRCRGDLRKAVNQLQRIVTTSGKEGKSITKKIVLDSLDIPPESTIFEIMRLAIFGKFSEACDKARSISYEKGFTSQSVIEEMSRCLFSLPLSDESTKACIAEALAEYEVKAYISGVNKDVLLNGILARVYTAVNVQPLLSSPSTNKIVQQDASEVKEPKATFFSSPTSSDTSEVVEESMEKDLPVVPVHSNDMVLKSASGLLLATIEVEGNKTRFITAKNTDFDRHIPVFKSFFLDRALEPLRIQDGEAVKMGALKPEEALSYEVIADSHLVKEITVFNFRDDRRFREVRSTLRWTLEKMLEKTNDTED